MRRTGGHIGRCGEPKGEEGAVCGREGAEKAGKAILVALDVGNAMRAAEAKGPCWDLNIALRESFRPGHTTSDMN